MAQIKLTNLSVNFPVFNYRGQSIKSQILKFATGGTVDASENGQINVRALDSIDLQLNEGDRLALLGGNGAGKSTLLRVMAGVYHPSSGRMEVQGKIASLIDISLGINAESTGRENIYTRAALLGIPKSEVSEKFHEITEFSDLGEFIDLPVRTYSSGMQLRLAFAVSTILKPEILIMDEWLSVGDEAFKSKADERLSSMIGGTKIMVLASHSRELVTSTCNKAIWLENGRIRASGTAAKVAAEYFTSANK